MDSKNKKIGFYLERTTRLVKLNFHQSFKNLGLSLTPEQWVIMDLLHHMDGLSQNELASQSFKDAPSISRILDTLSKKNYIKRVASPDDRRKFQIFLTKKGIEIVKLLTPKVEELRNRSWEELTDKDYDQFIRIINQVFKNLEK